MGYCHLFFEFYKEIVWSSCSSNRERRIRLMPVLSIRSPLLSSNLGNRIRLEIVRGLKAVMIGNFRIRFLGTTRLGAHTATFAYYAEISKVHKRFRGDVAGVSNSCPQRPCILKLSMFLFKSGGRQATYLRHDTFNMIWQLLKPRNQSKPHGSRDGTARDDQNIPKILESSVHSAPWQNLPIDHDAWQNTHCHYC